MADITDEEKGVLTRKLTGSVPAKAADRGVESRVSPSADHTRILSKWGAEVFRFERPDGSLYETEFKGETGTARWTAKAHADYYGHKLLLDDPRSTYERPLAPPPLVQAQLAEPEFSPPLLDQADTLIPNKSKAVVTAKRIITEKDRGTANRITGNGLTDGHEVKRLLISTSASPTSKATLNMGAETNTTKIPDEIKAFIYYAKGVYQLLEGIVLGGGGVIKFFIWDSVGSAMYDITPFDKSPYYQQHIDARSTVGAIKNFLAAGPIAAARSLLNPLDRFNDALAKGDLEGAMVSLGNAVPDIASLGFLKTPRISIPPPMALQTSAGIIITASEVSVSGIWGYVPVLAMAARVAQEAPKVNDGPRPGETGRQYEERVLEDWEKIHPNSLTYHAWKGGARGSIGGWLDKLQTHLRRNKQGNNLTNLNEKVLTQTTDEFVTSNPQLQRQWQHAKQAKIRYAQEIDNLQKEIRNARGDHKTQNDLINRERDLRETLDEIHSFEQGVIRKRRPDLIEVFVEERKIIITDITMRPGNAWHNFKTQFYVEVMKSITGWDDVFGIEWRTSLEQTIVEAGP
jgi:hypothetical protein